MCSSKSRLLISASVCALFSQQAWADTIVPPPVRSAVDENGVDVIRGTLDVGGVAVSAGPNAHGEIIYPYYFRNGVMAANTANAQIDTSGPVIVTLNGSSDSFYGTGVFTSTEGNGASLVKSGTSYTYTASDGTVATFIENVSNYPFYGVGRARATSITKPNGEKTTYDYRVALYCPGGLENRRCDAGYAYAVRLASIGNSYGYNIKIGYDSDTLNDSNLAQTYEKWSHVAQVVACIPETNATCSATGNWPAASFARSIDASSNVTDSVTDPLGRTTIYRKSSAGVFSVQRPNATSPTFSATFDGPVASVTNDGVTKTYAFTDSGTQRTTIITDANGGQQKYVSDTTTYRVGEYRDELNRKTQYSYDSSGRLMTATYPEGNVVTYAYDARGNRTTTTVTPKPGSPLPPVATSATYPTSCTTAVTCNKPTSTTDARGAVTDYSYDSTHGGVLKVTAPAAIGGAVRPEKRYAYTQLNGGTGTAAQPDTWQLATVSECRTTASCSGTADETRTTIGYGPNGQVGTIAHAAGDGSIGATATLGYDNVGNVTTVDGPLSGNVDTTTYRWSADRELLGVTSADPDGAQSLPRQSVKTTYNADGQPVLFETGTVTGTSDIDWTNFVSAQQTTTTYDVNARPVTIALSASGATYSLAQSSYDAIGRVACTAQRMNPALFGSLPASACSLGTAGTYGSDRIIKLTYNAAGQQTKLTTAYGTTDQSDDATTTYTSNGLVASATDAEGNKTSYSYDGFDRLSVTYLPSLTKGSGTSSGADYEQLGYDAAGNVTDRRLRDGRVLSYVYDALNRLTAKTVPDGSGLPATATRDVYYGYDLRGLPMYARFDNALGEGIAITYDAFGQVTSETSTMGGSSRSVYSGYYANGTRSYMAWPDLQYVYYDRDALGRLSYTTLNGATRLFYSPYDNQGRVAALYRGAGGGWGIPTGYTYDPVGRLASQTHSPGGSVTTTFGYNPASQVISRGRNNDAYAWDGQVNVDRGYVANGLNQYSAVTPAGDAPVLFSHDANGNLADDGRFAYIYDVENRLVSANNGTNLRYDPLGRLWEVTKAGATTRFLYDRDQLAAEYDAAGTLLRRYAHGDGADDPQVSYEGPSTSSPRYLYADDQGSIVAIKDASGAVANTNAYDEYGIPGSGNTGRFQYTGQTWLPELGMYYYKARMYSPTLGRFMQTDPIGYGDGLNWYNYVGSDPVNATDPSGLAFNPAVKRLEPIGSFGDKPLYDAIVEGRLRECEACKSGNGAFDRGFVFGAGVAMNLSGEPVDAVVTARKKQTTGRVVPQKPAYCQNVAYKLGVRLDNAGKITMMSGSATMVLGGAGAVAGAPFAGVGAAPGLSVAGFGATMFGRGALLSTGGNVLKAIAGDSSAIPSLVSDVAMAVTGGLSKLSEIGKAITGASSSATIDGANAAAGIGKPQC